MNRPVQLGARMLLSLGLLGVGAAKLVAGHGADSPIPPAAYFGIALAECTGACLLWTRHGRVVAGVAAVFLLAATAIRFGGAACGCLGRVVISEHARVAVAAALGSLAVLLAVTEQRPRSRACGTAGG